MGVVGPWTICGDVTADTSEGEATTGWAKLNDPMASAKMAPKIEKLFLFNDMVSPPNFDC